MVNSAVTQQETFLKYHNTIGLAAMEGRGFLFPSDTAIGNDGRIFTVNRGVGGDSRGIRVTVFNLDSEFFGTFGSLGDGEGQFISPTAVAVDSVGHVYVSDEYTHRIVVFDSDGEPFASWGVKGERPGELNSPAGIAIDADDNLYVSDPRNQRIQKFAADGKFLLSFGTEGSGDGQLNLPWGITIDARGDVYVADWRNDRIQKFSPDGSFIAKYGTSGHADGQLFRPSSVAVDSDGYIYVADWGNERIQVLDTNGSFVTKLRGSATESKWAREFLDTNVEEAEARAIANLEPDVALFGGDPHEESSYIEKFFWAPVSVKLDTEGRLYVTESNRHRIQVYQRG